MITPEMDLVGPENRQHNPLRRQLFMKGLRDEVYNNAFLLKHPHIFEYLDTACTNNIVKSRVVITKNMPSLAESLIRFDFFNRHNIQTNFTERDLLQIAFDDRVEEATKGANYVKAVLTRMAIIAGLGDTKSRLLEQVYIDDTDLDLTQITRDVIIPLGIATGFTDVWFDDALAEAGPTYFNDYILRTVHAQRTLVEATDREALQLLEINPYVKGHFENLYAKVIATRNRHSNHLSKVTNKACTQFGISIANMIDQYDLNTEVLRAGELAELYTSLPPLSEDPSVILEQLESSTQSACVILGYDFLPSIRVRNDEAVPYTGAWSFIKY